jgi:hypothetical protein
MIDQKERDVHKTERLFFRLKRAVKIKNLYLKEAKWKKFICQLLFVHAIRKSVIPKFF